MFLKHIKLFICTFCILFSASLQAENSLQNPELPPITDQRNAAVGYVFTYTAVIVAVSNTCKMVPRLSKNPNDTFLSWHLRNGQYFEAAKGWLQYVSSRIKVSQGEKLADEFRSRVIGEAAQTGNSTVKGFFSKDPPAEVCEKWMSLLTSTESDLINNRSEFNNELEDIAKFYKAVTEYNASH